MLNLDETTMSTKKKQARTEDNRVQQPAKSKWEGRVNRLQFYQ